MKKINKILIILVLLLIAVIFSFKYINKKITHIVMSYAQIEAKNLSSIIINGAVSKHIADNLDEENMFKITKDNNGNIKTVDYNSVIVNKFLTETTNSVQINLKNIEKGDIDSLEFGDSILVTYDEDKLKKGIIYEISSGAIFNNTLLANVGPKIPVKLNLVGDATSKITSEIKNYGINNALIEVYVNIEISEKIILPFSSKNINLSFKIPVAIKMVTGNVPKYYVNGMQNSSSALVVPTE